MRLERFVNENITIKGKTFREKDIDQFVMIWDKIQKECRPFLDELKKNNRSRKVMYRGERNRGLFHSKKPRKDRTPKDMPMEWHEAFDEWFDDNMGWPARSSGLFCTGRLSTASGYSSTEYIIFPVGRYEYTWSPDIPDLYSDVENGDIYNYIEITDDIRIAMEDEWLETYSEGGGNGEWFYDGTWYGYSYDDKEEAVIGITEQVTEDLQTEKSELEDALDFNDDETLELEYGSSRLGVGREYIEARIEEIENEIEDVKEDVSDNIEWRPEMDLDDYIEEQKQYGYLSQYSGNFSDRDFYNAVHNYCQGKYYDSVNLIEALQSLQGNEIMVKCDKYYAIHHNFLELVESAVWENMVDPRQLEFDFGKKRRGRR